MQSSSTSTITEYRLNTEYSINRMIEQDRIFTRQTKKVQSQFSESELLADDPKKSPCLGSSKFQKTGVVELQKAF